MYSYAKFEVYIHFVCFSGTQLLYLPHRIVLEAFSSFTVSSDGVISVHKVDKVRLQI